jgi:hypothetical protein
MHLFSFVVGDFHISWVFGVWPRRRVDLIHSIQLKYCKAIDNKKLLTVSFCLSRVMDVTCDVVGSSFVDT